MTKPRDEHDRSLPPELALFPPGLQLCRVCGEARGIALLGSYDGTLYTNPSPCLCDGVPCRCGEGMIRQPASDYYSWRAEKWFHVPWFGHRARCAACVERGATPR